MFKNGMVSDYKRGLWYGLFSPTPILPMSWWWEYFDSLGTDTYIARVRTILNQMLAAGKGSFQSLNVKTSVKDMQVFGVQCGNKDFIYCYNSDSIERTVDIALENTLTSPIYSEVYHCDQGKYRKDNDIITSNKEISISNFRLKGNSDVVFIISGE